MKLKSYLEENNMTLKDFAQIIDVSPAYISSISKGKYYPGARLERDIERLTGGQVTFKGQKSKRRVKKEQQTENTCSVAV